VVIYHPFTIFLEAKATQDNSVRAWSARSAPAGSWMRYHNLLYLQPAGRTGPEWVPDQLLPRAGPKIGLTSTSFHALCLVPDLRPAGRSRSASSHQDRLYANIMLTLGYVRPVT
jgi:hypothetical protein